MGNRDFNPLDIFLQLETNMRRGAEDAMRAVRFRPCADVYETKAALIVKMELAGVRPERLNITLSADDRLLVISGERGELESERQERIRCYQLEVYFGSFERQVALPSSLRIDRDNIKAHYRDGFLVVTLPKRPDAPPEKRVIEISQE